MFFSWGHHGKCEGDAVIAFWNAPVEHQDHSRLAVEAMVRCQEKLAQMRPARVAVVGKKAAVTVYELMTAEEYLRRHRILEIFAQSLQLFYQGRIKQALEGFSAIRQLDSPADHYMEKCQQLLDNPPDLDSWQGVWVATSK